MTISVLLASLVAGFVLLLHESRISDGEYSESGSPRSVRSSVRFLDNHSETRRTEEYPLQKVFNQKGQIMMKIMGSHKVEKNPQRHPSDIQDVVIEADPGDDDLDYYDDEDDDDDDDKMRRMLNMAHFDDDDGTSRPMFQFEDGKTLKATLRNETRQRESPKPQEQHLQQDRILLDSVPFARSSAKEYQHFKAGKPKNSHENSHGEVSQSSNLRQIETQIPEQQDGGHLPWMRLNDHPATQLQIPELPWQPGEVTRNKDGVPLVVDKIFWSPEVEQLVPLGGCFYNPLSDWGNQQSIMFIFLSPV